MILPMTKAISDDAGVFTFDVATRRRAAKSRQYLLLWAALVILACAARSGLWPVAVLAAVAAAAQIRSLTGRLAAELALCAVCGEDTAAGRR